MKCEVTHLGYVVLESGILAPGKVKAVRDLPASRNLSNYGLFWALPLLSDINTPIFSYVQARMGRSNPFVSQVELSQLMKPIMELRIRGTGSRLGC